MGILLKNKWLTFFYPLPSRILTKSNINLSLLSFEEKILSQLDDNQYILLIFKLKMSDNLIRSISTTLLSSPLLSSPLLEEARG